MSFNDRARNGLFSFGYEAFTAAVVIVIKLAGALLGFAVLHLFNTAVGNTSITLVPDFIQQMVSIETLLKIASIEAGITALSAAAVCLVIDLYKNSNHPAAILKLQGNYHKNNVITEGYKDEWVSFTRRLVALATSPMGCATVAHMLGYDINEVLAVTFMSATGLSIIETIGKPLAIAGRDAYAYRSTNIQRALIENPVDATILPPLASTLLIRAEAGMNTSFVAPTSAQAIYNGTPNVGTQHLALQMAPDFIASNATPTAGQDFFTTAGRPRY